MCIPNPGSPIAVVKGPRMPVEDRWLRMTRRGAWYLAEAGIPGPFPRRFKPHSSTCLRAETKVAKEIKA